MVSCSIKLFSRDTDAALSMPVDIVLTELASHFPFSSVITSDGWVMVLGGKQLWWLPLGFRQGAKAWPGQLVAWGDRGIVIFRTK